MHLTLKNGSKVAIIGGGPAGSFSAYFLNKYSSDLGLELDVRIFDGKDFLSKGPRGCNLCAGVISESLSSALEREGIRLPEERILSRLDGYVMFSGENVLELTGEFGAQGSIATVFRGNGPRYAQFPDSISFDDFLLSLARDYGAEVISKPIADILFANDPTQPLRLSASREKEGFFEADLVVGAFGVNNRMAEKVEGLGIGYKRPATLLTYQAEIGKAGNTITRELDRKIHVYLPRSPYLRYVSLTPKGDFVTMTAVGKKGMNPERYPEVVHEAMRQRGYELGTPQCTCFPRIVTSSAVKPYTDRFVIVGDAGYSRYYKNGIESAFITARLAAQTAVCHGIDAKSFARFYHRPAQKIISRDNQYGRLIFYLNDSFSRIPCIRKTQVRLADPQNKSWSARRLRWVLWSMFTGNAPYREIFHALFSLRLNASLFRELLKLIMDCFRPST